MSLWGGTSFPATEVATFKLWKHRSQSAERHQQPTSDAFTAQPNVCCYRGRASPTTHWPHYASPHASALCREQHRPRNRHTTTSRRQFRRFTTHSQNPIDSMRDKKIAPCQLFAHVQHLKFNTKAEATEWCRHHISKVGRLWHPNTNSLVKITVSTKVCQLCTT